MILDALANAFHPLAVSKSCWLQAVVVPIYTFDSYTVAPFQPSNLDKPRVDFCKAKKLNIVVNPPSYTLEETTTKKQVSVFIHVSLKKKRK